MRCRSAKKFLSLAGERFLAPLYEVMVLPPLGWVRIQCLVPALITKPSSRAFFSKGSWFMVFDLLDIVLCCSF